MAEALTDEEKSKKVITFMSEFGEPGRPDPSVLQTALLGMLYGEYKYGDSKLYLKYNNYYHDWLNRDYDIDNVYARLTADVKDNYLDVIRYMEALLEQEGGSRHRKHRVKSMKTRKARSRKSKRNQ